MTEPKRAFEATVELAASPDEVWHALTDAGELVRWFPLDARVTPGAGGETEWGWHDFFRWPNRIEAWEPGRRLLLVQDEGRPYDLEGRPRADGVVAPARVAIEFSLETGGDSPATTLRLVHSGFGRGAAWDDELDSISHGWAFELRSLAHYLAHHRGSERSVAWAMRSTALDRGELWRRLRAAGLEISPETPSAGARYELALPGGDRFHGETLVATAERQLAGTAAELGDGLFRIESWRAGNETGLMLWASSWRPGAAAEMAALQARLGAWADAALAG